MIPEDHHLMIEDKEGVGETTRLLDLETLVLMVLIFILSLSWVSLL